MGHISLVGGVSNLELLPEFLQLKEHCFGFVGKRRSELWNGHNDVVDRIFECLSCFNWCVNRHMGGSVAGDSRRVSKSVHWV